VEEPEEPVEHPGPVSGPQTAPGNHTPTVDGNASLEFFRRSLRELTPRVWVIPAIVVINLAVFGLMVRGGVDSNAPEAVTLVPWGANYGPKTLVGQPWRLVTSAFLHFGALHLIFNMVALWYGGIVVERIFGHIRVAAIYLAAAIVGSAVGVIFHPQVVSAGASGAVFGLYGALYVALRKNRAALSRAAGARMSGMAIGVLALSLFSAKAGVDIVGHVAGLLGGALAARWLALPLVPGRTMSKQRPVAALVAAGLLVMALGLVVPAPEDVAAGVRGFPRPGLRWRATTTRCSPGSTTAPSRIRTSRTRSIMTSCPVCARVTGGCSWLRARPGNNSTSSTSCQNTPT
jgi:rhomboid protease GluP